MVCGSAQCETRTFTPEKIFITTTTANVEKNPQKKLVDDGDFEETVA